MRLGIDVGGTHTDFVLLDSRNDVIIASLKVPTTPADLFEGVSDGLHTLVRKCGISIRDISEIVYGTTFGTNIIAEEKPVRVVLLTTEGFRDILEIGRAYREGNIYDMYYQSPQPLVPRWLRLGIRERMDFQGGVIVPIDRDDLRKAGEFIRDVNAESVAVCFLHSYANPEHEYIARNVLREILPVEVPISLSSEICKEFREYERTSTTVLNAILAPGFSKHLQGMQQRLQTLGFGGRLYMMQSNGGVTGFDLALSKPVSLLRSGPAAGVLAGMAFAQGEGFERVITLDMGGTSCDVSIVPGMVERVTNWKVMGYPVLVPGVDVLSIGAGGGSIAWLDAGGVLKVGPQSAGAFPGPACYGLGGDSPTVTDANVVLGRINPESFLQGERRLEVELAIQSIEKVARKLCMDNVRAAESIIQVANSNMVRALKAVSVARGHDPREFALVSFGGAAGLHIVDLAHELDISTVIVPPSPGTTSALGLLFADIRHDFVRTYVQSMNVLKDEELQRLFAELEQHALAYFAVEQDRLCHIQLHRSCDLRYFRQGYEINVPCPSDTPNGLLRSTLIDEFHVAHERLYGHRITDCPIELVNVRLSVIGGPGKLNIKSRAINCSVNHLSERRPWKFVYDGDWVAAKLTDRASISIGDKLDGPCLIQDFGSTVLVPPGVSVRVGRTGSLIISLNK